MPSTHAADFVFEPKVWSDHVKAYFDRYLVFGQFAVRNDQLKAEGSGLTVNFPYYKAIGDAEEPGEDDVLSVDKLTDDSFSCTVFEVGKAVGFTKKAFKKSAESQDAILSEAQRQIARVHAEKVDKKILAEIDNPANHGVGLEASDDSLKMTPANMLKAKIQAFGDKHKDAAVIFMHSLQYLDLMTDNSAGFLKADANDPMYLVEGFEGRMLGMGIVTVDSMTALAPAGGITKNRHRALICKENAYGLMYKQEMEMDSDKDILARQIYVTGNEWYAVKSFHAKISPQDKKIASLTTVVG
jgi:N4-gp56 family major capsid protein